jgi:hypothetical protein
VGSVFGSLVSVFGFSAAGCLQKVDRQELKKNKKTALHETTIILRLTAAKGQKLCLEQGKIIDLNMYALHSIFT